MHFKNAFLCRSLKLAFIWQRLFSFKTIITQVLFKEATGCVGLNSSFVTNCYFTITKTFEFRARLSDRIEENANIMALLVSKGGRPKLMFSLWQQIQKGIGFLIEMFFLEPVVLFYLLLLIIVSLLLADYSSLLFQVQSFQNQKWQRPESRHFFATTLHNRI